LKLVDLHISIPNKAIKNKYFNTKRLTTKMPCLAEMPALTPDPPPAPVPAPAINTRNSFTPLQRAYQRGVEAARIEFQQTQQSNTRRREALIQVLDLIEENSDNLPEGQYLKIMDSLKNAY